MVVSEMLETMLGKVLSLVDDKVSLKCFLLCSYPFLRKDLERVQRGRDLFSVICSACSITNCSILKAITNHFCSFGIYVAIEVYSLKTKENFYHLPLEHVLGLKEEFIQRREAPSLEETFVLQVDRPKESSFSLLDYHHLMDDLFHPLDCYLHLYAVMDHYTFYCYLPSMLMEAMERVVEESSLAYAERKVILVAIGRRVIFDCKQVSACLVTWLNCVHSY